jgi:integrase
MPRAIHKLKARTVETAQQPGLYGDGGGLYLQITKDLVKSWVFRYMRNGRARAMGLGPLHTISLAAARMKAHECRLKLLEGIDPLDAKAEIRKARLKQQARTKTFKQCATAYIKTQESGWKNKKHASQWTRTLETYAYPIIGDLPVAAVDLALVNQILTPIWTTKTETASRIRGRIESILDWAKVQGYRDGDNPARWRGNFDKLLPRQSKVAKVRHHPALPYADMPAFYRTLLTQEGSAALALAFLILTATRTGEVLGARLSELDLKARIWHIPAERMKAAKAHRIPLSDSALTILERVRPFATGQYVFPGRGIDKPLSNMALLKLLARMGREDLTTHGLRSTFRDWAAECTNFPREICEAALAHTINSKTAAAYQRGDLLVRRATLMNEWASYCDPKG